MNTQTGKWLVLIGLVIVIIGTVIYFFGDKLHWFGRLPGDIKIEKEGFKLYFPIVTMLLLSGILNLVIWIIRKFF